MKRILSIFLSLVLTAALLAPVVLPALQMQRQEPENPIRKENIQPVRRLSFGDGDGGTLAAAPLTQETGTGGSQSGQEQNPEQPPEEQTGENVPEQLPEQPRSDPEPQPGQESGEQPGERTDGQPDDAGDETQPDALDLGLVLTWYRYGGERYRSLCPSDTTVRQDVRTAQLPDGKLRYELELRGLDAVDYQRRDFGKQRRICTGGRTRQHCHAGRPAGRGQLLYAPRAGSLHARAGGRSTAGAGDGILLRADLFRRA